MVGGIPKTTSLLWLVSGHPKTIDLAENWDSASLHFQRDFQPLVADLEFSTL